MKGKPGTVLKNYFASRGIKTHAGCKCNNIASRMDRLGPDGCMKHLRPIATAMRVSAKTWKQEANGIWKAFPIPPLAYFEHLVKWAANKSR